MGQRKSQSQTGNTNQEQKRDKKGEIKCQKEILNKEEKKKKGKIVKLKIWMIIFQIWRKMNNGNKKNKIK